ncbi:MAG: ABC transporter ATP-binding protein [Acidimicrobiaceae bacterium]|nr:ABC transporter ATP-binding protein [Acidimicrobiaceae bacterium]
MLTVSGATVTFGRMTALDGIDLQVATGEVVAILGPSGCGKSTLLRAVAGLQPLDAGQVCWDGEDLVGLPVHRRDFGLMFQEHALFSHRDVAANVAFGLRMQKMDAPIRRQRVREVLAMVGLAGFEERPIATLSGGEAQRVALARSLAPEPRLLMLDEPLGSLDRPRRDELTEELRSLLRRIGVTVLHVTHDHDEAFAVADRVAVMQSGRIARIGGPAEIWHAPRRAGVARFLGHANVVAVAEDGAVPWGRLPSPAGPVVLRADAFGRVDDPIPEAGPVVAGTVSDVRFRGDRFELTLRTDPGDFELLVRDPHPAAVGDRLTYTVDPAKIAGLDAG